MMEDGGGRRNEEGRLAWLHDRQQLAIKTKQGWRELQVQYRTQSRILGLFGPVFTKLIRKPILMISV